MGISEQTLAIVENTPTVIEKLSAKQNKVQGAAIIVDNVSSVEHTVPCRLEGKNLFEFKQGVASGSTGVQLVEELETGAIIQGVVSGNTQHNAWANGWYTFENKATVSLKAGDTVTISADYTVLELAEGRSMADFSSGDIKKVGVYLYGATKGLNAYPTKQPTVLGETVRMSVTYTLVEDADYYPTFTINSNKVKIENIQIEYGSTATAYTPYITDFSQIVGKNLLNPKDHVNTSNGNATVTVNNDGGVVLNGGFDMENGGTYAEITYTFTTTEESILSLDFRDEGGSGASIYIDNVYQCNVQGVNLYTKTLSLDTHTLTLHQNDQSYSTVYLQLEKGSIATEYEPWVEPKDIVVTRYGKNLFDTSECYSEGHPHVTTSGILNGSFVLDKDSIWYSKIDIQTIPDVFTLSTYIVSNFSEVDNTLRITYWDSNNVNLRLDISNRATASNNRAIITYNKNNIPDGTKYISFSIRITDWGHTENTQIEVGSIATAYEPYKEPTTHPVNADGTVEGITSIAPSMTLLSNHDKAVIEAKYFPIKNTEMCKKSVELKNELSSATDLLTKVVMKWKQ